MRLAHPIASGNDSSSVYSVNFGSLSQPVVVAPEDIPAVRPPCLLPRRDTCTMLRQLTIGSRGMWLTRSHAPSVTIAVSPMHMLSPVVSSRRTMWRKNTMPGSRTCGFPAHTIGQSIHVGGYIAPMV